MSVDAGRGDGAVGRVQPDPGERRRETVTTDDPVSADPGAAEATQEEVRAWPDLADLTEAGMAIEDVVDVSLVDPLAEPGRSTRTDLERPAPRVNTHRWVCTGPGRVSDDTIWQRLGGEMPLLRLWASREFSARYRQSVLDIAWSVIQPAATLAIYGVLLVTAFHVSGDTLPYLSFAWAGMCIWAFMSNAIGMAVPGLSDASGAMSKTYFPREIIPLAVVGAAVMDLVVQTAILVVIAIIQGVGVDRHIVALLAVYAVAAVWTAALCVLWSALAAFIRDVRHATGLILQAFFFASPIMYPVTRFPPHFAWTAHWNPVAILVEATRDAALRHRWPAWSLLGMLALVGLVLLAVAITYVRSVESRMVDLA